MRCTQCGRVATGDARGWQAHRTELPADFEEDDDLKDVPPVVFFCPECAEREFGS